ncbi:P22 phage major capsid protein family protein [Streptomyces sp. NPDC101393]|uniref:P22 phage major capsid protein family protein n=1 Tax=Streptomyces sp. NPDC101393 TaxID=3366141 RepID=UPI0037F44C37
MANNAFLKPEVIANAAVGMLERELILSNLVWTSHGLDFTGAKNDTVSLRIPSRLTARTFPWRDDRSSSSIVLDNLAEDSVSVSLSKDIYSAVAITDEELTLDISDFGTQVLDPQVRAVAAYLDAQVAAMIEGAAYGAEGVGTVTILEADGQNAALNGITRARTLLNKNDVPQEGRTLLVGADFEEALLSGSTLLDVSQSGSDGALREATIGRIRGFNVVTSNAIDSLSAYAFVPSAFLLATRAPAIPSGATFGAGASFAGYSMRWIRDYDASKLRDRSIVNAYAGTKVMLDQPTPGDTVGTKTLQRAVKLVLTPDEG